jgi:hypothetical protein
MGDGSFVFSLGLIGFLVARSFRGFVMKVRKGL